MEKVQILETTLRDGSYVLDFQFTASDTEIICSELEKLGFDMIEVGHGIGLGASENNKGLACESDEGYMEAAAKSLTKAKWGMFCIPGIATLAHIDLAAKYEMDFIRIGTDVTKSQSAEPFIARAKKHGMFVCSNFMKSYAIDYKQFAEKAKQAEHYGSDVLYIVDSAGGMLTDEMEGYIRAVREVSDISIGFHGHNNLELAIANSLRAVELGVNIIDTSLQGFGRSAGNTPTEIFLLLMERKGMSMGIDPIKVMDLGERYIKPLIQRQGYESIDLISGYSQFHSSYMSLIRKFSSKYNVDPRKLIVYLTEKDKVNAPPDLVESLAKQLHEEGEEVFTARFNLHRYHGDEQSET